MNHKAYRDASLHVNVTNGRGSVISSDSVTDNLLFLLLEKMEEIRCSLIDVETLLQNQEAYKPEQSGFR